MEIRHLLVIFFAVFSACAGKVHAENAEEADSAIVKIPAITPQPLPYLGPRASNVGMVRPAQSVPFAKLDNFVVDLQNRQNVQAFYNSVYSASENTAIGFTGDVASCSPGTTASLFKDAVRLRVNWFRELAGVPDVISFRDSYSSNSQDAALIMAANGVLTHFPPSNLTCYTSTGDVGAQSSNLAIGSLGWDSVKRYMDDNGSNNAAVGHRRWMIHPPIQEMGTGDVPATQTTSAANSIWVFDDNIFNSTAARDGYVAWPPPGKVPYNVVPSRWSFGLEGADFSSANVVMASGASNISVITEPVSTGAGLNTLVWVPMNLNPSAGDVWPNPGADTIYSVTVSNVLVGGDAESFSYDVTIFDPTTPAADDVVQNISGPDTGQVDTAEWYSFPTVAFAEANAFRSGQLQVFAAVEGAETGGLEITDGTDPDYSLITSATAAAGSASFQLAHPNAQDQNFVWERQVLLNPASALQFSSRLGLASTTQIALAQISADDGQTWADVYSQAGTNGSGESGFTTRTVSLAAHAGKVIKLRFAYDLQGGSYFPQTSSNAGFFVDEIRIVDAQELSGIEETPLGGHTSFSFVPQSAEKYALQAQFIGWSGFPGSAWGPILEVDASTTAAGTTAVAASVLPASRSVFDTVATAFATMINGGSVAATECRIVPAVNSLTSFTYQITDPATNALTGQPNTPVDIPAGLAQTFAIFFDPSAAFAPVDIHLSFDCANTRPAPVTPGLNTLLLSSGAGPVPDIVALAATSGGGIVDVPGATGTGVFAVATVNAGIGADVRVSAAAPAGLGANVFVCETEPATGACISELGSSVLTNIAANETPTFGFFVQANGQIPFDPAGNRVVVTFADEQGVTRGATSVAVRTN